MTSTCYINFFITIRHYKWKDSDLYDAYRLWQFLTETRYNNSGTYTFVIENKFILRSSFFVSKWLVVIRWFLRKLLRYLECGCWDKSIRG